MNTHSTNYDIYGIGAALLDTEIQVDDNELNRLGIEKGLMTLVDEARQKDILHALSEHLVHCKRSSGGSAANTVIGASYFGSRTFYSCKVADDDNGRFYLDDLSKARVASSVKPQSAQGITGKCLVLITPDAQRTMNTFLGASETLSTSDVDEEAIAQSRYVYIEGYLVTSPSGKKAAELTRELAMKYGRKIAISLSDPALAQHFRAGLKDMIGSQVDLIFCNEEEALAFTEQDTLESAREQLKHYARDVVITRGAHGAMVSSADTYIDVAAAPTEALDTNGAGDMFAAAFLHAICAGHDAAAAASFANRAAAKIVSRFGPRLTQAEYEALLPVA